MMPDDDTTTTCHLIEETTTTATLVLQSDTFGVVGYALDKTTGELTRICICFAHAANDCVCGAWDIEKTTPQETYKGTHT